MTPMSTCSRRSLGAAAATAALLSTCYTLPGSEAFNAPLHVGLTSSTQSPTQLTRSSSFPRISHSNVVATTVSCKLHLMVLQSTLIEEPPSEVGPDSEDGELSTDGVTAGAAATDLEDDNFVLKDEPPTEKPKLLHSLSSVTSTLAEKVGVVDESRIAFPELTSGQVPRLYSNLKYSKSEDGKVSSSEHASGSTLAATAVIAGQALGVSMLHLPSAVAPSGFLYSSAAMVPTWIYSVMSGLLIAELCINRMGMTGKADVKLMDLYNESLGKVSSTIGAVAYFGLQFAIILACIATGGENIGVFLNSLGMGEMVDSVPAVQQFIFAMLVGSTAFLVKPMEKDSVNNFMLIGAIATLLGIIGFGAGSADFAALLAGENQHPEAVIDALPIVFMALSYQTVMPKITAELEGDKDKITTAVIAGTAIPFFLYVIWNAVVLGNAMAVPGLIDTGVDSVSLLQTQGSPLLGGLVSVFSELVVASTLFSFVGNFVETNAELLKLPTTGEKFDDLKPFLYVGALLPAVFLSAGDTSGACRALDYAGAFSLSTLFLVLPSIMIWRSRYGEDDALLTAKPMVPLGKVSLSSLWKAAGTLIIEQGAEKLGIIGFFKDQFLH